MNLLSMYIDYILDSEFENIDILVLQLFRFEANVEVQMLVLDKLHTFYKENFGNRKLIEKLE